MNPGNLIKIPVFKRNVIQYAPVWFGISIIGLIFVFFTKYLSKKFGPMLCIVIVPSLGYMCITTVLMCLGSVGAGKLPTGLGEAIFGAETGFAAFQVAQTSLSSIFSQIIPPEFIVRVFIISFLFFGVISYFLYRLE